MKVSIIGGGGRVGSCAAFALECMGLVSEIQIIDANAEAAEANHSPLCDDTGSG